MYQYIRGCNQSVLGCTCMDTYMYRPIYIFVDNDMHVDNNMYFYRYNLHAIYEYIQKRVFTHTP